MEIMGHESSGGFRKEPFRHFLTEGLANLVVVSPRRPPKDLLNFLKEGLDYIVVWEASRRIRSVTLLQKG